MFHLFPRKDPEVATFACGAPLNALCLAPKPPQEHRLIRSLIRRLRGVGLGHYVGSLGVRALEVLGKFGLYVVAARVLGGYDAGLLFFCLTWVNLASAAARMGLERTMTRHIAAELAIGAGSKARWTLLTGMEWTAIGSLGWAAVTGALAGPVAVHVFGQPDLAWPLAVSAIALIPQTLAISLGYALTGVKRGALGQLVSSALPPVLVLVAMLLGGVHRLDHVLLAYAGAFGITAISAVVVLWHDWQRMTDHPPPAGLQAPPLPSLRRTALPFLAVELVQAAMISLPLLLLGAFADPVQVGAFSVASRMSTLVWMVIISIGAIAAPRLAEHYRRQEWTQLAAVNRLGRRMALMCSLPPVIAMLVVPDTLLSLVGPHFDVGARSLVVLALGQLVNAALPLQDVMLGMTGHGRTLRLLSFGQLGVGIVLGIALIPAFGSRGAAITTSACVVLGAVGTTIAARRLVRPAHAFAQA